MKIIDPYSEFETPLTEEYCNFMLRLIERAARTCYKTECRIAGDIAETKEFVRKIALVKKHESVIEHANVTVRFVCDRGVTHELVRHRLAAYSQESTRYCNYGKDQFGQEITVIRPLFWSPGDERYHAWERSCAAAEREYFELLARGASPQEARSVLPNSLKTEIVMTANLRQWKHVFKMRCAPGAHPQMRQIMVPLFFEFRRCLPEIYDDPIFVVADLQKSA